MCESFPYVSFPCTLAHLMPSTVRRKYIFFSLLYYLQSPSVLRLPVAILTKRSASGRGRYVTAAHEKRLQKGRQKFSGKVESK